MKRAAVVWGGTGRMGAAIAHEAPSAGFDIVGVVSRGARTTPTSRPDVVIDFSSPDAAFDAIAYCVSVGAPLVSGTTGLGYPYFQRLDIATDTIAALHASNMSLGVAVLRALTRAAAAALPRSFDVEIVETHHRRKSDAPSGTALSLEAAVGAARTGRPLQPVHGRHGVAGPRDEGEIGLHAVRGGDVVGEHEVLFLGDGERVALSHRATDRAVFARGALRAAAWIVEQPAGRYQIDHVVGLAVV